MTQEEFAAKTGLKRGQVNYIENSEGAPDAILYMSICKQFKLDPIKFAELDMAHSNVYVTKSEETIDNDDIDTGKLRSLPGQIEEERFKFLMNLSVEEVREGYIELANQRDALAKQLEALKHENLELFRTKDKFMKQFQDVFFSGGKSDD